MPDFNSLFGKAKAKAEGLAKQHNITIPFGSQSQSQNQSQNQNQNQQHQNPPTGYYPPPQNNHQQNYQQAPGQYPGNTYPPQNQYNQQQGQYPPQNQYPPPGNYNQNQYQQNNFTPPPQQNFQSPPPQSFHAPPIPGNKPPGIPPNKPGATFPPTFQPTSQSTFQSTPNIYWTPSFSPSTAVSENFKHQTGAHGWGNAELQNYIPDPANSFHTPDNKLVIRAISQHGQYTSARLTSHQTLSKQRGSLIAVATPPCAAGIWPALWLLPSEPFQWPNEAEIDILETWNADNVNHTCLHWGHFNGEDWNKHRVIETNIGDMATERPIRYEFTWQQDESAGRNTGGGRAVWYIDGRAVMKAEIPAGARRMSDWQIIINIAMGGNVCQGKLPADGSYDMIVHELRLCDEPSGGWGKFEADWHGTPEGHH